MMLTDDECVALAVDRGTYWPGALPTVDAADEMELAAAAFRGHRSLFARELLDDDGVPVADLASWRLLAGPLAFVSVYLGDESFARVGWGLASTHVPVGEGWISESVNPVGVHHLTETSEKTVASYFETILTAAFHDGPEYADISSSQVCVVAVTELGRQLVAARNGRITSAGQDTVGTVQEQVSLAVEGIADTIGNLLVSVRTACATSV